MYVYRYYSWQPATETFNYLRWLRHGPWSAYSAVEKRLPRKVSLNERQTSLLREDQDRERAPSPPTCPPAKASSPCPVPFHLSGASKRSNGFETIHASLIRSFRSSLHCPFVNFLSWPECILTRSKNDGPITWRRGAPWRCLNARIPFTIIMLASKRERESPRLDSGHLNSYKSQEPEASSAYKLAARVVLPSCAWWNAVT